MSSDPVRRRALEILVAAAGGADPDPLLDKALATAPSPRDAGFLAELVRGTLQWQGRYDHVIAAFSRKKAPDDPRLVAILRLSLHQLLGLDGVPAYAAIHQAGELCREAVGRGKVAFVNGMLQAVRRRVLAGGADPVAREAALRALFADLESDRPRWLAAWFSLPQWLVTRWIATYGPDEAAAICAATNQPAPLYLHVLGDEEPSSVQRELAAAGVPSQVCRGPRTLLLTGRPSRAELQDLLARRPRLIVQDAAVQAATAWLLADLPPVGPVLDLCAAPGGKTAHLATSLAPDRLLLAMDNRPARLRLLAGTVDRAVPGRVPLLMGDAAHPPFAAGVFGGILLDGPCSGTGVLRHHPDGRWRLRPATPGHKARSLQRLIRSAADLLAPGGRLMYATCSLEPEENEAIVAGLLAERDDLAPDPDAAGVWQRRWLPHETQADGPDGPLPGDGFFASRLVRTAANGNAARTAP